MQMANDSYCGYTRHNSKGILPEYDWSRIRAEARTGQMVFSAILSHTRLLLRTLHCRVQMISLFLNILNLFSGMNFRPSGWFGFFVRSVVEKLRAKWNFSGNSVQIILRQNSCTVDDTVLHVSQQDALNRFRIQLPPHAPPVVSAYTALQFFASAGVPVFVANFSSIYHSWNIFTFAKNPVLKAHSKVS